MKIGALETMRRIRAEIAKETEGMSGKELEAYFQAGSREFRALMAKEAAEEARRTASEKAGAAP